MKNFSTWALMITIIVIILTSCGPREKDVPKAYHTLKLYYMGGSERIATFKLPTKTTFKISSSEGSYSLSGSSFDQCFDCVWSNLEPAVVRFEVISVEPIK